MSKIRLSEKELKTLLFIDDKINDPVKLSHQLDIEEKTLNLLLKKLEEKTLIKIKNKSNKPFSLKLTTKGQSHLKKNKDKLEYC